MKEFEILDRSSILIMLNIQTLKAMVIIFIFSFCAMCFFLYCFYKFWKEDCEDLREAIFHVGFKETLIFLATAWLMWFSFTTPSSMISEQYIKNGKITAIEHSLSGKCDTITDIKKPTTTYGYIINIKSTSYLCGKLIRRKTIVKVKLNDGREMEDVIKHSPNEYNKPLKEGNGMSVTETYYPTYGTQFNY